MAQRYYCVSNIIKMASKMYRGEGGNLSVYQPAYYEGGIKRRKSTSSRKCMAGIKM